MVRKDPKRIDNIFNEIESLRKLKHPFIIELYEIYESNKYVHLILEYLDGGELFKRIKSQPVYQESTAC